jgi:hypothetical protein
MPSMWPSKVMSLRCAAMKFALETPFGLAEVICSLSIPPLFLFLLSFYSSSLSSSFYYSFYFSFYSSSICIPLSIVLLFFSLPIALLFFSLSIPLPLPIPLLLFLLLHFAPFLFISHTHFHFHRLSGETAIQSYASRVLRSRLLLTHRPTTSERVG